MIISGYVSLEQDDLDVEGSITKYNLQTQEFELLHHTENGYFTQHYCIERPNDSTYYVATRSFIDGVPEINTLTNYDNEFNERWQEDYFNLDNCFFCTLTPKQILPLSNGNIAYMYEEFKDLVQFTDRIRTIMVIMDGITGEQISEEILVGDHEGHMIWAGGMVEQDGDILVSYSQPYYYDQDGEWQPNIENSIYFEKYNLSGDVLSTNDLEGEIPNGNSAINPSIFYRITQMQTLEDGNLFLSGTSGFHGLIMKTDQNGNLIWYQQIVPHEYDDNPVAQDTDFYYAAPTSDGGFMMAGKYESDPSGIYPQGFQTAIALKVDEYGCLEPDCQVGIEKIEQNSLSIYPNPSSGKFVIELPSYEKSSLKIINAVGEEVLNQDDVTGASYEFDLTNFPKGIYMVLLESEEGVYSSKIIKE